MKTKVTLVTEVHKFKQMELECPRCGSKNIKGDGDTAYFCLGECEEKRKSFECVMDYTYFQYEDGEYFIPNQILMGVMAESLEAWRAGEIKPRIV